MAIPKKIIDIVRDREVAIRGNFDLAEENASMAVAALQDGIRSRAWEKYMFQFVEKHPDDPTKPLNPAHLERLLGEDNTSNDPAMSRRRAYMISNGMCGGGSPGIGNGAGLRLDFQVESIDHTLPDNCP